jgi:hypothetical protein
MEPPQFRPIGYAGSCAVSLAAPLETMLASVHRPASIATAIKIKYEGDFLR